jgi:hypothetical protein
MRKLIATLFGYLAVVSLLAGGVLGGVVWLIRTDGAESATVRAAPLPPRIADSIERKKALVPPQPPPVAALPYRPLQEANAALSQPPRSFIRELAPPRAKPQVRSRDRAPLQAPAHAAAPPAAVPITVRSDNFSGL